MINISLISFSYKRGLSKDLGEDGGGFVFDCRSLPNPYWDESLRKYTGRDEPICAFMDAHRAEVEAVLKPIVELLTTVVETYAKEGRERLHVAFGCTGGQHRSVYCAETVARRLRGCGACVVEVNHAAREFWKTGPLLSPANRVTM